MPDPNITVENETRTPMWLVQGAIRGNTRKVVITDVDLHVALSPDGKDVVGMPDEGNLAAVRQLNGDHFLIGEIESVLYLRPRGD